MQLFDTLALSVRAAFLEKNPQKHRAISDWNDIQFTLAVAEAGSFSAAGLELGVHSTTVARRVQRLEKELGTKLFIRHAYGMELSPAGNALISKAAAMEEAAKVVRHELLGLDSRLTGDIRISVPEGIGRYWLTPALKEFQRLYPEIRLEVLIDMGASSVSDRNVDIAIMLNRPTDPKLVATRVGKTHYNLFASRTYLRQAGFPKSIGELHNYNLVDLYLYRNETHLDWWNDLVKSIGNVAFVSNSSTLFLAAIQDGLGIGMAPSFCKFVVPDLMTLEIQPECSVELWLSWHEALRSSGRMRALIDFLKSQFARDRSRWFS